MFLLVFGTCAVAALVAAVLARPLVGRLIERVGDSITKESDRTTGEAKEFAAKHEQSDCLPETFRRLAACGGFWCQLSTPDFTKLCLARASPSPKLCDEVPRSIALAAIWPTQKCLATNVEPSICRRIYSELVTTCSRR